MRKLRTVAIAVILSCASVAGVAYGSTHSGRCTNMSRACAIAVARTYVDAQAGGPGTAAAMRLAPNAIRWENGLVTGSSGANIRAQSGGGASPIISPRDTHNPTRVFVDDSDPNVAQVFFLWFEDVRAPNSSSYVATAHIFERVQVQPTGCGGTLSPCITQIEAVFCIGNKGREQAKPAPSPSNEPKAITQFLCYRGS